MTTVVASEWSTPVSFTVRPLGTGYSEVAKVLPLEGQPSGEFGHSVAIDGEGLYMLSGVHAYSTPSANCGLVEIYKSVDSMWKRVGQIQAPTPTTGEYFGYSVAMSKDGLTAYIGATGNSDKASSAGCVYVYTRPTSESKTWTLVKKLYAADAAASAFFGYSLSVDYSGSTLVVGACGDARYGALTGAAYIFKKNAGGWYQSQKLNSNDRYPGVYFGRGVAISGNGKDIVVSAPTQSEVTANTNSLYHFTQVGPVYIQVNQISSPDLRAGQITGGSLALSDDGTILAVGSTGDRNRADANSGCVYVYEFVQTTRSWIPKQKIVPTNTKNRFGQGVSLSSDGSFLMVGSGGDDTASDNAGAVYVYDRISEGFLHQQQIFPRGIAASDHFGGGVALNYAGDVALVCSPSADDDAAPSTYPNLGAVYYFVRNGTTWTQSQKIVPTTKVASLGFGSSVAMSQDGLYALIGAATADGKGAVYYFKYVNGAWKEMSKLTASDGATSDLFGTSVALSADGTYALIGAIGDDNQASNCGNVYIFTRSGDGWTQQATLACPEPEAAISFGSAVSLNSDATKAVMSAYQKTVSGTIAAGAVYYFTRSGSTWTYVSRLVSPRVISSGFYGSAVALNQSGTALYVGAYQDNLRGVATGAVFAYTLSGSTWIYDKEYLDQLYMANNQFGVSLSLSGDGSTMFVGSYSSDEAATDAGGVTVYVDSKLYDSKVAADPFVERCKFYGSDTSTGDRFGVAVALNAAGDYAVVGAPFDDDIGVNAGAVYTFARVAGIWVQKQKFYGRNTKANDNFGISVAITADASLIFVGAFMASTLSNSNGGAVYAFEREGEVWRNRGVTFATSEVASTSGMNFGRSIACDSVGTNILVSAPANQGSTPMGDPGTGAVFYLTYSDGEFTERQKILTSTASGSDYIGQGVAMSGDGRIAIIGSPNDDNGTYTDDGSAFVFTRAVGTYTWTQEQKLSTPDPVSGEFFGYCAAISGNGYTALISRAYGAGGSSAVGAFYLYNRVGSTWTLVKKFYASDAAKSDYFSAGLALNYDGTIALVGAADDDRGLDAGAVYMLATGDLVGEVYYQRSTTYAPQDVPTAGGLFGAGIALSGDGSYALVGACYNPDKKDNSGCVYIFERSGMYWNSKGYVTHSDAVAGDSFAVSIAMSADAQHMAFSLTCVSSNAGAVYYYTRSGDTWTFRQKVVGDSLLSNDRFGAGLAMSGDGLHMLAGAETKPMTGTMGRVYYFTRSGSTWTQQAAFVSPDLPVTASRFGGGLALNYAGDYALIGEVFTDLTGTKSGLVRPYTRSGTTWTNVGLVHNQDLNSESDAFGIGMALSRDARFAIICGSTADDLYRDEGGLYLYERNTITGKWYYVRQLKIPASAGNTFGRAVAMSETGSQFIVGQVRNDDKTVDSGAFHYFSLGYKEDTSPMDELSYRFRTKVIPIDGNANDHFGYKTAVHPSGNWMFVGAREKERNGVEGVGTVYNFRRLGNKWVQYSEHNLSDTDIATMGPTPRFGSAVALEPSVGSYLAVGAAGDTHGTANYGYVYMYQMTFTGSTASQTLYTTIAPPSGAGVGFGESISMSNDAAYIAVSTPFYSDTFTEQGRVDVFTRSGTAVTLQATIISPTPQAESRFGNPIYMNPEGDTLYISSYYDNNAKGTKAGAVYIYKRTGATWAFSSKILPPEVTVGFGVGIAVDPLRKLMYLSAIKQPEAHSVIYKFDISTSAPTFISKVLDVDTGVTGADVQYATGLSMDAAGRWLSVNMFYRPEQGSESGAVMMYSTTNFDYRTEPYLNLGQESKIYQYRKLLPPTLNLGYAYGARVKVSPDETWLMVSEILATVGGFTNAGRVHMYNKDDFGNWAFYLTIDNPTPATNDYFGMGIELSSNGINLAISAYRSDVTAIDAGVVHTFQRNVSGWTWTGRVNIPEAIAYSDFGSSIAFSADSLLMAVGSQNAQVAGVATGAVYFFTRVDIYGSWAYSHKLYPSDLSAGDGFGWSVSLTAVDRLAVSSFRDATAKTGQGSVYIYQKSLSGNWLLQAKITAPDPNTADYFGSGVSLTYDGSILAVGAQSNDSSGSESGVVYIFTCRGNDWVYRYAVRPTDAVAGQYFGASVDLSKYGNHLFVGSHTDPNAGTSSGSVYEFVHHLSPFDVNYTSRLVPWMRLSDNSLITGDEFMGGAAVSEDGTMMVLGFRKDHDAADHGYACFYRRTAGKNDWFRLTSFAPADGTANDLFGATLKADSTFTHFLIGGHAGVVEGQTQGKLYYYTRSNTTFTLVQTLISPVTVGFQGYGVGVGMNDAGDLAAVGVFNSDASVTGGTSRGCVYIYTRTGSTWTLQQTLLAFDKADGDNFGAAVEMSGDGLHMLVSSRFDDDAGENTGSVYYYTRSGSTWTFQSKIYDPFPVSDSRWGVCSLNTAGDVAMISNYRMVTSGITSGVLYKFKRTGTTWKFVEFIDKPIGVNANDVFANGLGVSRNMNYMAVPDLAGAQDHFGGFELYANPTITPEFFYR